jgi:transposase InsO family protein
MRAEKARWPVAWMSKRLKVSTSGFYSWLARPPPKRARRDQQLAVSIAAIHTESRGTYGSPSIRDELAKGGQAVGKKRVARLMRLQGLRGQPKKRFVHTTDSAHDLPVAKNLVQRRFQATRPNELWVTDISYIATWEGFLYLAVVLDVFSRRIVGWAVADHMRTELPLEALAMAVRARRPPPGLVHHSDRGSQYASHAYQVVLQANAMLCSMSRKGDCWDNAMAESFFATLKNELLYRQAWPTKLRAAAAINEYIACFYNRWRRHTGLGGLSPEKYEAGVRLEALVA